MLAAVLDLEYDKMSFYTWLSPRYTTWDEITRPVFLWPRSKKYFT